METGLNFFAKIDRVAADERMVYGYVSTEALDGDGEIVEKAAVREAWDGYAQFGNIREMHQPSAAGVMKVFRHDDKGTWIGAHIVDDSAWAKVVAGVYKGFSIGGKKLAKLGNRITKILIREISLADRPANPEAVFTLFKIDKEPTMTDAEKAAADAAAAQNDDVNKAEGAAAQPDEGALAKVEGALGKVDGAIAKVEGAVAKVEAVEIRVGTALEKADGRLAKAEGAVAKLEGELAKVSAMLQKALDLPADDGVSVTTVAKPDDVKKTSGAAEPEKPLDPNDTLGHMAKALGTPVVIGRPAFA